MELTTLASRPAADGFWMPAEWLPHEAVWMLWPYRADNWRESGRPAQHTYAAVAEAIEGATPVFMGVPEGFTAQAKRILPASVTVVPMESDDAWMRDVGPTVVINERGERRGVDWIFNAWGGLKGGLYYPWDRDEQVAPQICSHHKFARYQAAFVLEGGAIHTDGDGTLLVTEEVMLNPDRNPALTKEQIGDFLKDYLDVDKIIWLPLGVFADETSGHIDNMCCFARPGEVILTWTDDTKDPQYARSSGHHERGGRGDTGKPRHGSRRRAPAGRLVCQLPDHQRPRHRPGARSEHRRPRAKDTAGDLPEAQRRRRPGSRDPVRGRQHPLHHPADSDRSRLTAQGRYR
jgi:agmatine deiminase